MCLPLVPALASTLCSEEAMWNLFLFCNPACTARIQLQEPPWTAPSLTHILIAPRGSAVHALCATDPPENQILFTVMPLASSGLGFPALLHLGNISHLPVPSPSCAPGDGDGLDPWDGSLELQQGP